jgi:hypothetical protein
MNDPERSRLPTGGPAHGGVRPLHPPEPEEETPHPPLEVERLPERDEEEKLDEGEDGE